MAEDKGNIFGVPMSSDTVNTARGQILDAMSSGTLFRSDPLPNKIVNMSGLGYIWHFTIMAIVYGIVVAMICMPSKDVTKVVVDDSPIPVFGFLDNGYRRVEDESLPYVVKASWYRNESEKEYVIRKDKQGNRYSYLKGGN